MRSWVSMVVGAMMLMGLAAPVGAVVTINTQNVGYSFGINYGGQVNALPTDQISAEAMFTFTGVSNDSLTYYFDYTLTNTSAVESRIRSLGFTTSPNIVSASSNGSYQYASYGSSQQFPGISDMEMCFRATSNGQCNGGPGGLTQGQSGGGSFALTFAQSMSSFNFDGFAVRYQSINPGLNGGGTSGVGQGSLMETVSAAPEPGTWMMLILGFGAVGAVLRRRPRAAMPTFA